MRWADRPNSSLARIGWRSGSQSLRCVAESGPSGSDPVDALAGLQAPRIDETPLTGHAAANRRDGLEELCGENDFPLSA